MRTTIDLPDELFREVKATAASRGLKLKEFIAAALEENLRQEDESKAIKEQQKAMRKFLRAMDKDSGRVQTGPVGPLNREELYDRHD
jgi:metal-responsive CopG/Arc/MetJ family transcriptional regulator